LTFLSSTISNSLQQTNQTLSNQINQNLNSIAQVNQTVNTHQTSISTLNSATSDLNTTLQLLQNLVIQQSQIIAQQNQTINQLKGRLDLCGNGLIDVGEECDGQK